MHLEILVSVRFRHNHCRSVDADNVIETLFERPSRYSFFSASSSALDITWQEGGDDFAGVLIDLLQVLVVPL